MQKAHTNPAKVLFRDRQDFRSFHDGEELSFKVIAALYAGLFGALFAVWLVDSQPLPASLPVYVAAYALIGWAQYSIGNGMHEAVHNNLCNKKSDWVAWALTSYPVGLFNDRQYHLEHHRYLGTERDPDYPNYINFPRSKFEMILRFVWFLSGVPAVIQALSQMRRSQPTEGSTSFVNLASLIVAQVLIIAVFWIEFGNPIFYIIFWVAPVATVGKLLSTTRLLCEHGSPTRTWVVRTIDGKRWQTWLMGAFDFNYHGEHHLFPSVPYPQLDRLHRRHRDYAEAHPEYQPFDGRLEFFSGGYLALLTKWFATLPWRAETPRPG